jgi:hypothetical protein
VGQAFTQVVGYITGKVIKLTDVTTVITVMETGFVEPDSMATAE